MAFPGAPGPVLQMLPVPVSLGVAEGCSLSSLPRFPPSRSLVCSAVPCHMWTLLTLPHVISGPPALHLCPSCWKLKCFYYCLCSSSSSGPVHVHHTFHDYILAFGDCPTAAFRLLPVPPRGAPRPCPVPCPLHPTHLRHQARAVS